VDLPRGMVRGVMGFAEETTIAAKDLSRWVLPLDATMAGVSSMIEGGTFMGGVAESDEQNTMLNNSIRQWRDDVIAPPDSTLGGMVEGISQFMMGFIPVLGQLKGIQLVNQGVKFSGAINRSFQATSAAALTSSVVFNPDDPNLANLLQSQPKLRGPVTEFLATDPSDHQAINRARNALVDLGLGPIADGFLSALKGLRAAKHAQIAKSARLKVDRAKKINSFDNLKTKVEDKSILITAEGEGVEAGRLELMDRGERLQVIDSSVSDEFLNAGNGKKLYDEAANMADTQGKTLVSDTTVSDSAARVWDSMKRRGDDVVDQRVTNPDNVETVVRDNITEFQTRNGTPLLERKPKAKPVLSEELPPSKAATKETPEATSGAIRKSLRESLDLSPETIKRLNHAVESGNLLDGDLRFFNGDNIDWDGMAEGDSLKRLLLTFEDILETELKDVNRGVQSHADIQRLAKMV
ncbi:hypothetical protein LCGC14_2601320, partial [marine sediment metagenome]